MTVDRYFANGNEEQLLERAFQQRLPVMLTGPTGCGKTRLVEHIGGLLERPVVTISCHDDLTSADLVGRFLVTGGDVVWQDGPLTRAVRQGAICYLDEVVEARHDSLASLHSLTDHRRTLYLDRTGEVVAAPGSFMLVCSYNPAYRSSLKDLKPSFRQRFVTLAMNYLPPEREADVLVAETGIDHAAAARLVRCATAIRNADEVFHLEPPSTRAARQRRASRRGGHGRDRSRRRVDPRFAQHRRDCHGSAPGTDGGEPVARRRPDHTVHPLKEAGR